MSGEQDDLAVAYDLLAQGKQPEAFNHLVKARAATRDLGRMDMIANAMEQAEQIRSAHEVRAFIIAANPTDVAAHLEYLRLGAIVARGDASAIKTVENELDALVAGLPRDAGDLWLKAAFAYRMMDRPGKAVRASKRAAAVGWDSADMLISLSHFYIQTGCKWRAWWTMRRLFRHPDMPNHRLAELSWLSREAGCPNLAMRFARRAQRLDPSDVNALVLEARAFVAKGQPRRGAALIKNRLQEFQALEDHGHQALQASPVLLAAGELEAERSLLQHAAAKWPDNQAIATALEVAQFGTARSSWPGKARA